MPNHNTAITHQPSPMLELRGLLWLVLTGILFFQAKTTSAELWLLVIAYLASCGLLLVLPGRWIRNPKTGYAIFFADMIGLTVLLYSSSGIQSDSLLLWYLTVFIATAGEDLKKGVGAAVVVAALYFWQHTRQSGGLIYDTQALLHLPLFFATATSCGYLAQEARARESRARKRTEEALVASQEKYENLAEQANDILIAWEPEGRITSFNKSAESTSGYAREEALQMKIAQLFAPECEEPLRQAAARAWGGEKPRVMELQMVARDGRHVPVEMNLSVILQGGTPVAVQAIAQDITERKNAERALQDSEKKYRLLFENSPQPTWVYDFETLAFLAVNDAAVLHYGYSRHDFLSMTMKDIRPEGESLPLFSSVSRRGTGLSRGGVCQHRKKDGTLIDVEVFTHPIEFSGRPAELMVAIDITAPKRTEDTLRTTNQILQTLIHASPVAILTFDVAGLVKSWNPAAERIFGWTGLDALGLPLEMFILEEAGGMNGLLPRILSGEVISNQELRGRKKDGSSLSVTVSAAPLSGPEKDIYGLVMLAADVTDRKHLEEQFRQAQKMEAVGRLAGGVAHDFNNLLTIILGYSDMLLESSGLAESSREYAGQIRNAAERAGALTRQLLAFSRREVQAPQILDLDAVLANLQKMLVRLIGEHIEFVTVPGSGFHRVKADPGHVEQAILNLVVNARDAMPQGGKITVETAFRELTEGLPGKPFAVPPGRYVMLSVTDTGCGMDEETQSHIFEPFFTTKTRDKGTGLGLAVVYGMVTQSGGHVQVSSEPGRGAAFKIFLPAVAAPEVAVQPKPAAGQGAAQGGSETVLLVEDEEEVRSLASRILEARGYKVLAAGSPLEAIRICGEYSGKIHLLLTDITMPEMSGQDLAAYLGFWTPETRVLFISGYIDSEHTHFDASRLPAPLLQKPFTPESLLAEVRRVLESSPAAAAETARSLAA
jgi:two-component system cell cycle sensor histidine kinase/response regulator CckA